MRNKWLHMKTWHMTYNFFLIITKYNLPFFYTPRIYWYIEDFSTHLNIERAIIFQNRWTRGGGHSHNYDATIKNIILLVGLIFHLFSFIHRLICPISHNSPQISCILKVFYNDIGVYFNVCIKFIYMYTYVYCSYNESQN